MENHSRQGISSSFVRRHGGAATRMQIMLICYTWWGWLFSRAIRSNSAAPFAWVSNFHTSNFSVSLRFSFLPQTGVLSSGVHTFLWLFYQSCISHIIVFYVSRAQRMRKKPEYVKWSWKRFSCSAHAPRGSRHRMMQNWEKVRSCRNPRLALQVGSRSSAPTAANLGWC